MNRIVLDNMRSYYFKKIGYAELKWEHVILVYHWENFVVKFIIEGLEEFEIYIVFINFCILVYLHFGNITETYYDVLLILCPSSFKHLFKI